MHLQGFERLIKKMDEIAGKIDEEVIMQIGFTKYKPKNAKYFDFINDFQKVKELNRDARIVVCHGGAGTIITSLEQNTPVIAVPRLKIHDEHLNDHQLEIVDALAEERKIIAVKNVDELENLLKNQDNKRKVINMERDKLVAALKNYIDEIETKNKRKKHD